MKYTGRNPCHFNDAASRKLDAVHYGDISICQADFSFASSKLIIQTLIVDKCSKTISIFCASVTILKHQSIYQNNHSQVLVIKSVKITIMNTF